MLPLVVAAVAALLVGRSQLLRTTTTPKNLTSESENLTSKPVWAFPVVEDKVVQAPAPTPTPTPAPADGPRGIRNNNPGNIRWDGTTNWRGMVAADPAGFVIFDTPEHGIRAMARILNSYEGRGVITLAQIVNTWAPPMENNTGAYVTHLARLLNIAPNDRVNDRAGLIAGIIKHENGQQPYSMTTIQKGVSLA